MNQLWGSMEQYSTVVWHWPIAVYLFLAGLSAGAAMTSLIVKWIEGNGKPPWDGLIKAGAILAPVTICLGLFLLIFDFNETRSTFNGFWGIQRTAVQRSTGRKFSSTHIPVVHFKHVLPFR